MGDAGLHKHRRGGAGERRRRPRRLQLRSTARGLVDTTAGAKEAGGLSTRCPSLDRGSRPQCRLVGPDLPIVGVGGIDCGEGGLGKIAAGIISFRFFSLVYEGPGVVEDPAPSPRGSPATASPRSPITVSARARQQTARDRTRRCDGEIPASPQ